MIIMAFSAFGQQSETSVKATDIGKFFELSTEAEKHRRTRLISIDQFNEMSKDGNTIILDSRSAEAYEMTHLKGAINLNFSDFTEEKLAKVIPNKKTRILIYCNNNFQSIYAELGDKDSSLALNIPTFINLYGYGYKNIYELESRIVDSDKRLNFSGTSHNK